MTLTVSNQGTTVYYYFCDIQIEGPSIACTSVRDTVTATVGNVTGINNTTVENTIAVYPNPANGQVNVRFDAAIANGSIISITDVTGRTVSSSTIQNVAQGQIVSLNTENINAGTYFLTVKTENKNVVQKLVITK